MKKDKGSNLKTNVARLLDAAHIPYELVPYEVDENDLAATHIASRLGEDIKCVFKTLVLRGERNGLMVCVVPGDATVDLKRAYPTFFHTTATDHERIYVSAGQRGVQLHISPCDLIAYTGAEVTDLIED